MTATTIAPVLDRQDLAGRIERFISTSPSSVVLLHGRVGSGKTEIVLGSVIPSLRRQGREAWYGDCARGVPEALDGADGTAPLDATLCRQATVFLDHFGGVLSLPTEERHAALDRLLGGGGRGVGAPVVLVLEERDLAGIYDLTIYDPRMIDASFDLGTIDLASALEQLGAARPEGQPRYHDEVLRRLDEDAASLESQGCDVTFELVRMLDRWFSAEPAAALEPDRYNGVGRLRGILRNHLRARLADLGDEGEEVARAVLESLAVAGPQGLANPDRDLLAQLGLTQQGWQDTLSELERRGLLKRKPAGAPEVLPQQLAAVLREDAAERRPEVERARRTLDEGLRGWTALGAPLPRKRFTEIHLLRRSMTLDGERIRFMLQMALHYDDHDLAGSAEYWLLRLPHEREGVDILLASLYADCVDVRRAAGVLLSRFGDAEVRDRLRGVALSDKDQGVRARAVASLAQMQTPELMQQLIDDATSRRSAYRIQAVEALRVFRDDRVIAALRGIVADDAAPEPLRGRAISALGSVNTAESVDALLEIALHDHDDVDRAAAAAALREPLPQALQRQVLERLHTRGGTALPSLVSAGVTVVLVLFGLVFASGVVALLADADSGDRVAAGLILLAGATAAVTGMRLLLRDGDDATRVRRIWATALFFSAVPFVAIAVHGLPYAMVRRWRLAIRALILEGVGLGGLTLLVITGSTGLPGLLGPIAWIYVVLFVLLLLVTCSRGIYRVLLEGLLFRGRLEQERRKELAYERFLSNESAARLVLSDLESEQPGPRREARRLLTKYGGNVPPAVLFDALADERPGTKRVVMRALRREKTEEITGRLVKLWGSGSAAVRARIAGVLCRKPNEHALEALERLHATATLPQRLRFHLARWLYRVEVWPPSAIVVVALMLPFVVGAAYHGWKVLKNPAWGQIMTIATTRASPLEPDERDEMVHAATVLARYYPRQSAATLLTLFQKRTHAAEPEVHAAIGRALVAVEPALPADSQYLVRYALLGQSTAFRDRLVKDSSAAMVLSAMAGSRDRTVADTATRLLLQFLLSRPENGGQTNAAAQQRVLNAMGRQMAPMAALLLLDTLQARGSDVLGDKIRLQANVAAQRAYAQLVQREADIRQSTPAGTEVDLRELRPLAGQLQQEVSSLLPGNRLLQELSVWVRSCDVDGNGICNDLDDARRAIQADSDSVGGYQALFDHYAAAQRYDSAAVALRRLEARYQESIWPPKLLSTLYHENSYGTPGAFRYAYDESLRMRQLEGYGRLVESEAVRLESDFVEVALSAGAYDTVDVVADRLLARDTTRLVQLNMRLFRYAASVLRGNYREAEVRLGALESVVNTLPDDYYNNWLYPGTVYFLEQQHLSKELQKGLLRLCREGAWYDRVEAARIIEQNRQALRDAAAAPSSSR